MKRMQSFFWWCAGIDRPTIDNCPSETSKYVGIGASVFFTGIFASLAAGYALYTVFDSIWYAILFGLIWGLMIFNLDRYIVSSMRKKGRVADELLMAAPRIILAIIISVVIAKPLELKVFEKEIDSELALMRQEDLSGKEAVIRERYRDENIRLKQEIATLQQAINDLAAKRDELRRIAQEEADGTGGSMRRNAGPIYRIKKADADRAEAELEELRSVNNKLIAEKLAVIRENDSLTNASIFAIEKASLDGLASRLNAMDRLTSKSVAINIAHWFILLLFIAVESAPIFVKLIAPRGPYDYLQSTLEYQYEASHYEEMAKTNAKIKRSTQGLTDEEAEYVQRKLRIGIERN